MKVYRVLYRKLKWSQNSQILFQMYKNLNLIHWHLMQIAKNTALQHDLVQQYANNFIPFERKGLFLWIVFF